MLNALLSDKAVPFHSYYGHSSQSPAMGKNAAATVTAMLTATAFVIERKSP